MYYKEKRIKGIWHMKGSPTDEWKPMSSAQLNRKINNLMEKQKLRKQHHQARLIEDEYDD